jgi:hypothetical protein
MHFLADWQNFVSKDPDEQVESAWASLPRDSNLHNGYNDWTFIVWRTACEAHCGDKDKNHILSGDYRDFFMALQAIQSRCSILYLFNISLFPKPSL